MGAKELFAAGDLAAAIVDLNQQLRSRPADIQTRAFLFELLSFAGDFERAQRQLDVLETYASDPASAVSVAIHRGLVAGELLRRKVFEGSALPKFVVPPPAEIEEYVLLLARLARGESDLSDRYMQAADNTPAVVGLINGARFTDLRDADDRVAPVLECIYGADYLWLPWTQIRRIAFTEPARLRDLLWMPARVEIVGQPAGDVHIPALYVNSHLHANTQVRLGRMTDWSTIADQVAIGVGQRMLVTDDNELPLLELKTLEFEEVAEVANP